MDRTSVPQPDQFCAYYELSASSDFDGIAMMKSLWGGATSFLRDLILTI